MLLPGLVGPALARVASLAHPCHSQIKTAFEAGSELVLTILKAMGEEQIHAFKIADAK